jgi:ferredoxin
MKISVNKEECIGCGACASICSEVFKMNDKTNKAEVKSANSKADCAKEAADSCPVKAIKIA